MRRARLGLRRSHLVPASGGAVFDPATLSLTGWWRAAYAGSPWAPTASAGTSGTANRDLGVDSGAATPSVGTALNGLDTADFDGSTQSMADGDSTLDTYVSAAAYTGSALVYPRAAAAPAGNIYDNPQLIADISGAAFGLAWSTSGFAAWHDDGTFNSTPWVACSADAWHRVDWKLTGGSLKIRVDSGVWSSAAKGNITVAGLTVVPRIGRNWSNTRMSMLLAELMLADTAIADADLDSIGGSYDADRYGL
jgi:hypothetical protein